MMESQLKTYEIRDIMDKGFQGVTNAMQNLQVFGQIRGYPLSEAYAWVLCHANNVFTLIGIKIV